MIVRLTALDPRIWVKNQSNIEQLGLFNKLYTGVFLIDPTQIAALGGTKSSQLSDQDFLSLRRTPSLDLSVSAASHLNSAWSSNGWAVDDIGTFLDELAAWCEDHFSVSFINQSNQDVDLVLMQGPVSNDSENVYTVAVAYFGNRGTPIGGDIDPGADSYFPFVLEDAVFTAIPLLEGSAVPNLNSSYKFNGIDYSFDAQPFAAKIGLPSSLAKLNVSLFSGIAVVQAFPVSIVFSSSVGSYAGEGIEVTNGTLTGISGSGSQYVATITPTSFGTVTVQVLRAYVSNSLGPNRASNLLSVEYLQNSEIFNGQPLTQINSVSALNNAAIFNRVDYSSEAEPFGVRLGSPSSLTQLNANIFCSDSVVIAPFNVSIVFSGSVSNFASEDITVTNGTVSSLSGSGDQYVATVVPTDFGVVTVSISAGSVSNALGNNNASNVLSVDYVQNSDVFNGTPNLLYPLNTSLSGLDVVFDGYPLF